MGGTQFLQASTEYWGLWGCSKSLMKERSIFQQLGKLVGIGELVPAHLLLGLC